MDGFIDRLSELLRSLFGGGEETAVRDPDLDAAWEELDDFMGTAEGKNRRSSPPAPPGDENLRRDYANLEVPFGADIEEVKRSYKTLILRYHPDKHAGDPEKQRIALEISKKINESFERIRKRSS